MVAVAMAPYVELGVCGFFDDLMSMVIDEVGATTGPAAGNETMGRWMRTEG
jgi:hypothetical protein